MSRFTPVVLFSTALCLIASLHSKSEAQTATVVPSYFFSTWTVSRDCTEAHAGPDTHTQPGLQLRVTRASSDGASYSLEAINQDNKAWKRGWRGVKLEYRSGAKLATIPADFECVPGQEASSPFLAQSGFAVSAEPFYPYEHWYGLVTIHGQKHHLLIFPRDAKGADSAAIMLIDADAGSNLQLDTNGTIIVES